jgi:uncharacterized protein (DUF433 family)
MTGDLQTLQQQLQGALQRIERLEQLLGVTEDNGSRWRFLVARPHPWRKQLSVKGRNMTVGQLLSVVRANGLSPEQASEDLELPVEAIREALAYGEENRVLLQLEASEERRRLAERGHALEPQNLPR